MAIDHWRAHSTYNIDDPDIAVLLCERCNNIHSNRDASNIMKHYISDIDIIDNWIKKELDIRSKGFKPNSEDENEQHTNIKHVINKYKEKKLDLTEHFKYIIDDNTLDESFSNLKLKD